MYLSKDKVDRYGIPQVVFDFEWSENEINLRRDAKKQADRLLKAAGAVINACPAMTKCPCPVRASTKWVRRAWAHDPGTVRVECP